MTFHDQQLEYERLQEQHDPGQQADEPVIDDRDYDPDPDIEIFDPS